MSKKMDVLPFSHPVPVATLQGTTHLKLSPHAEERKAIARHARFHALDSMQVDLDVAVQPNGLVAITGHLAAIVQPICVVSLDPFESRLEEHVEISFAPQSLIDKMVKRAEEHDIDDFDAPDPILDGMIDFGMLSVEFLLLALDPYPKKPDAVFAGFQEADGPASPFAALQALAGTPSDDKGA